MKPDQLYTYAWSNNAKRLTLKGRVCKVMGRAEHMGTILIEFLDDGSQEIVSRRSLRKVKEET